MRKFSQMVSVIALGFAVMTTASNAQRQSQAREAPVETQESYDRNGPPQEGDDFYCRERRLGQWFYCERPQRPEEEQRTSQADTRSATARLAEVHQSALRFPTRTRHKCTKASSMCECPLHMLDIC